MDRPFDLNEIAIFCSVAEERNLTRAAVRLGLPNPTVSRKLTTLENGLGVRLLHRSPRGVELTEAGLALHAEARTALAQIGNAAERVRDQGQGLHGKIRVTTPADFGATVCGPLFCEFLRRYPDVTLELEFADRNVDLIHEGFDFAVRVGPLQDPSLVARQISAIRGTLVASPAYSNSHSLPATPAELSAHRYIEFSPTPPFSHTIRLNGPDGSVIDVPLNSSLRVNSLVVVREAVLDGIGIARLPNYLSKRPFAAGTLVPVLPGYWTDERSVSLVHTGRRLLPTRVTVLLDFLAAEMGR